MLVPARQEQGRLRGERERLREENERLKRQLEEAQRANKRQAAPFSRGQRNANPRPPGRKPGTDYGQHYRKTIPQQVDQVIAVPLPAQCGCGGALKVEKIEPQYQHEVVRKTIWRRFDIAVGRCRRCGRRVQGRDPRQPSDALGADPALALVAHICGSDRRQYQSVSRWSSAPPRVDTAARFFLLSERLRSHIARTAA